MPQLIVRKLEEPVVQRLREEAAKYGISVEEAHRRVLRKALLGPEDGKDLRTHLLAVDEPVALRQDDLGIQQPISVADGLLAATALHHDLTVVTRTVRDFEANATPVFNPFR